MKVRSLLRQGLLLALLFLTSCTCRDPGLEPVPTFIRVEPSQLDFGRVVVGQVRALSVEVVNSGKTELEGRWTLEGEAFSSDDATPSRAVPGSTLMAVRCAPTSAAAWDGVLRIALAGYEPVVVPLSCEGVAVPDCVPSGPCRSASWDTALGRCVEADREEGAGCQASDVCLLNPTCRAGRCEGVLRDCLDADPCTSDSCHPTRGCEHTVRDDCPGAGPCRVGRCASGVGCELVDAEDGTPCGPTRTCTLADVCVSGACVQRRPPDGFTCAPAGPCSGRGVCVDETCQQVTPATVQPAWTLATPQPDGGPPEAWSDLFADRDGGLMLSSYFMTPPVLRANGASPITLGQSARRCIEWLGWVVCGDLPALASAPVTAIDPATGQQAWSFQGAAQRIPELVGPTVQFFTARLAVLSESELLVLYESRTLTPEGADPRCRAFAMVVLDRQGQPLRSLFLDDPIFSVCDHPHSYGVAVDAQSNIYLAFTPSGGDNPATSLWGTTFFSYSPSLQLRWRRFEANLQGGELVVGEGLLFQERQRHGRSTQTGDVVTFLGGAPFGQGLVGSGRLVPHVPGLSYVEAYASTGYPPRWRRSLSGLVGQSPLSIARWQSPWGPRDVVLAFTSAGGRTWLEGTELLTGAAAFSCPVELPEPPRMTVLTPGGLGVMWGTAPLYASWPLCDDCDPKFARTKSAFGWLPLPGIGPSSAAWPGAWGNAGHGHRESH